LKYFESKEMFFSNHILLAVDAPDATPVATPSITGSIIDVLVNPVINPDTDTIPKALNSLWDIAMNGNMYRVVSALGITIAIFAVGFWCAKFYKVLEDGGMRPAFAELAFPLVLVILLSNGGSNMRKFTLGARDMMNSFNKQINIVIDADVSLRSAMQVLTTADTSTTLINMAYGTCQKQIEINEFKQCVRNQALIAKGATTLLTGAWPTANTGTTNGDKYQQEIDRWKAYSESTLTNTFKVDDLVVAQETPGVTQAQATRVSQITGFDNTVELRRTILSFRGAFLYIIEIMMLVTALIGPVPLALSLFPVGTRPIMTWLTSFLSLGFCKICFSLFSGLSSLAMVYSGPENVDMLVAAIVLGLLAPVLSFTVASGAGIGALSTVSYSAQPFKIGTGITPYTPESNNNNNNPGGPY
jgi:hypothetical protein